jgi:hypothetical protein
MCYLSMNMVMSQGLYTEMKFEKPSRIQALTLPMIMAPPFKNMIAQVRAEHYCAVHKTCGMDAGLT